MKKIAFLFYFSLFALTSFSQLIRVDGTDKYQILDDKSGIKGIDYVFIINEIIPWQVELVYTGSYATLDWYKFDDPATSIGNQLFPDGDNGYILKVDGVQLATLWVIDYQHYMPNYNSLQLLVDEELYCDETVLTFADGAVPKLEYQLPGSSSYIEIPRNFSLSYKTRKWNDTDWVDEEIRERIITLKDNKLTITPAVLARTDFTITEFESKMGAGPFVSQQFDPFAVEGRAKIHAGVRDALNEIERPKDDSPTPPVKGSAPIEITFKAYPSYESGSMFTWNIFKEKELITTRTGKDCHYIFTAGKYYVTLKVENGYCAHTSDSVLIEVSESLLAVPNVFTPNSDGINDEFRVVYRSLASFECWVYNTWGKLVYHWSDAAKGWDGRVNGRQAPSGTYFYIIKAKGTDGVVHDKKGDINIIR